MQLNHQTIATACLFMLMALRCDAMGYLPPEDTFETTPLEVPADEDVSMQVNFQHCLPHPPKPEEICFVSGGISADEVAEFKARAKEFLLEIVFVQKADPEDNNRLEEYLAEVNLQIKDSHGNEVINLTTEGPFFLADLPLGKYQIMAEHEGVVKTNVIRIAAKKHQRVVFLWDR